MSIIEAKNLVKCYKDVRAVDGLTLSVEQGELFALLGINGAGKTTAIKLLCGLTRPTEGDATLCGYSVREDARAVKRCIAVSPQETAVAPKLTARENLELIAGAHGMDRAETCARIDELSEALGLADVLHRPAGKLSGGWQRRLSIAMALITRPQILFLDEPTLGLDVLARSELWNLIRSLRANTTIILTTHYLEEVEALSDRVGIMKRGKLIAQGTVSELLASTGCARFEEAFIKLVKEEEN